jgi:hypothetical protein
MLPRIIMGGRSQAIPTGWPSGDRCGPYRRRPSADVPPVASAARDRPGRAEALNLSDASGARRRRALRCLMRTLASRSESVRPAQQTTHLLQVHEGLHRGRSVCLITASAIGNVLRGFAKPNEFGGSQVPTGSTLPCAECSKSAEPLVNQLRSATGRI